MTGEMRRAADCTPQELRQMYALMADHYDNTEESVFLRDLADKDYVLLLHQDGQVVGFTTQKCLTVEVDGKQVPGVFSGDTIIRRDLWGDMVLFRVWIRFWLDYAADLDECWWFLICKGYKTYRILPTFWREFYPTFRTPTPERAQRIMDAYASVLYPEEYNPATGVIEYSHVKDKLRAGIADIDAHREKNPDIAFFRERNPGYRLYGNDLVCLAKLDVTAMNARTRRLLGI